MAKNIHDIAKAAGVSITTVSKVINNRPHVSPKTRARVQQVIRDEQFIPNHTARGLVQGNSKTIGMFLTTGLTHPFFSRVVVGLEKALKETGYDLLYLVQFDMGSDYSIVQHCLSRNVDGVLIFGFQSHDLNFEEMLQSGIPTMFIDMDFTGPRAGYITSENIDSIKMAVRYLHQLQHQRIAFINGHLDSYVGKQRFEGYRLALQELDLPYDPKYISIGDFSKESGYAAMQEFLKLSNRPTSVICCSDMIALGVMEAAAEAGLSVPDDLSVIGFDGIEMSRHTQPALTTVQQDFLTLGEQAIRSLNEMIHSPNLPPPSIIVPTSLVIRDSCAVCPL
ncbi:MULTISPECIES: LacI family DNA-binding transcriptional regulator [unclassified Paenibacillus]|uniref:LacI family DNA-binding transcriptional regulator n=1 Tax=unclassified Paenibacillus TaxID=185978 RepID=UPI000839BC3C|nr:MULTISPECIES: LacI family DNA-binding transcriptional regulator [unclassified Paenibacillus]NWL89941.1 LacI family transcriptional regulator [Paenibacillus sp. 79R4]